MGVPKQKWSVEEENALKAGVVKHGAGKWRTILKDAEFNPILRLRSNVDLKDKWRNMSVMANGYGSREKARQALKRSNQALDDDDEEDDDDPMAPSTAAENAGNHIVNVKPLAIIPGISHVTGSYKSTSRIDNLIVEAIVTLKEHGGSNKTAIAMYIEDQYMGPPNFKELLSTKLKALTASGKLVKVKGKYRLAPISSAHWTVRGATNLSTEEKESERLELIEKDDIKPFTKAQIDAELAKMRSMTAKEAAAVAAQAVAEAEAAMLEAEEAAREAEMAEADAEAAKAFAEDAKRTLKSKTRRQFPG